MNRYMKVFAAAATLVAFGGAGVTLAGAGDQPAPPAPAEGSWALVGDQAPVAEVSTDVAETVGAFERSRAADDTVPVAASRLVEESNRWGVNLALSQRVTSEGEKTLYLMPGVDSVCFSLTHGEEAEMSCETRDQIQQGGNRPAMLISSDVVTLMSVVPDGVAAVSVELADGTSVTRAVEANGYVVTVPLAARPTAVSYDSPAGPMRFEVTIPAAAVGQG